MYRQAVSDPPPARASRAASTFSLKVVFDHERATIVPVGELDLATVDQVRNEFDQLRAGGVNRIVLDLRRLTFMDSTALHLIVRAQNLSVADGFDFALIDGNEPVCRVLDITGLRDHLNFTRP